MNNDKIFRAKLFEIVNQDKSSKIIIKDILNCMFYFVISNITDNNKSEKLRHSYLNFYRAVEDVNL